MLETKFDEWGDRVRICSVTIDEVSKYVSDEKWDRISHFLLGDSSAHRDYGVQGVPHVILIDQYGKIVFIGHPASRDLEQDIDMILNGLKLTGEGTSNEDYIMGEEEE
jgi:hypothetical protein